MTDLESLIVIDTAEPDNRIAVHPRLWNALVRECMAARDYDQKGFDKEGILAYEALTAAMLETDAAMKG